jgi:hypothetical protein
MHRLHTSNDRGIRKMERVEAVFHYSEVKNKTFGPGFESRIF